ncbi:hypothetical protein B2I21_35005 [Chryseobacterium mucoviscidosis]|nr:hypothetical protein B2I21_35005 [Chryseobacterium mucoviscidosis]
MIYPRGTAKRKDWLFLWRHGSMNWLSRKTKKRLRKSSRVMREKQDDRLTPTPAAFEEAAKYYEALEQA